MTSGVIVGCTSHANQWRVSSGKKYSSANATSRNGTITAPEDPCARNTRSSRPGGSSSVSEREPNLVRRAAAPRGASAAVAMM